MGAAEARGTPCPCSGGRVRVCDHLARVHCPLQMKPRIPQASLPPTGVSVSVLPLADQSYVAGGPLT